MVQPNPTPLQNALGIASVAGGFLGNYGDFLRGSGGQLLLLFLIGFFFSFRYLTRKNEKIKYAWHKQVLKLPERMILKKKDKIL